MDKNDLLKSIDELLKKVGLSDDNEVKKSFDEVSDSKASGTDISLGANGGGDVIKNKDEKEKDSEKVTKNKDSYKSDDKDEDDKDSKKEPKEDKGKMKKSFEVSQEDYDLLMKSKQEIEAKAKAEAVLNDPIYKAVQDLTTLVKSQSQEIEALKKIPAHEPKSLVGYEPVAKSESTPEAKKLAKSQVLSVMERMCKSGTISSEAVIEYELTKGISNAEIKGLVLHELQTTYGKNSF